MRMSASWVGSQGPPNTRLWRDDWAPAAQFPSRFSPRRTDGRSAGPGHHRQAPTHTRDEPRRQSKIPPREGAHAHVRLDEGARLVDERRPLSSRAWEGRKIKREMGVISAHRPRPPIVVAGQTLVKAGLRPPPPAASALTSVQPATFCAAKVSTGRSGPRADPRRASRARHHTNFPLDKKDLIQGRVRGRGDWPHRSDHTPILQVT